MDQHQSLLSAELSHRFAAIDIGTNSMRLIIAEALRDGNYRILDEEKETTRLGAHLNSTGKLDPDAVRQSIDGLRRMKQIAEGFQVREMRVIATCAVREAADGAAFRRQVKREVGLKVECISAQKEAHLAFASVARAFDLKGKEVAVADIGGGSTEILLASGGLIEAIYTTPLGAVRIGEMFGNAGGTWGDNFDAMLRGIDKLLKKHTDKPIFQPQLLIGSGGTFTTLAEMIIAQKKQHAMPVRGYQINRAEVTHLLERLRKMPLKTRRALPGLSPDRVDIIVPGLAVIDRLMRRLKVNRLQVHDRGVRDGLLLSMLDAAVGQPEVNPHDRDAAVERFAVACGTDLEHGRQVARLSAEIFAQLVEPFALDAEDRPLLEAAARLQDAGYLINYDQHHKHSYHLILNSRLAGFQPHELQLVANVARYHRGSLPKKKHTGFGQLTSPDQDRVRKLAAILRIAGGLDRSHSQQVQTVEVQTQDGETTLTVVADQLPDADLWGAQRRTELFELAFGTRVTIDWRRPGPSMPAVESSSPANSGA
jgi:exopolyphosphatase / guanosine-5'-triphosphate,3'-diphosphate pyrophosphatase